MWRTVLPAPKTLKAQRDSFLISTLNSFQGVLKVSSYSSTWFNPCRWQVPICSWQWRYFLPILKMWKQALGAELACPSQRRSPFTHSARPGFRLYTQAVLPHGDNGWIWKPSPLSLLPCGSRIKTPDTSHLAFALHGRCTLLLLIG